MLTAVSESALIASANISLDPAAVPFVSVVNAILIFVVYDLLKIAVDREVCIGWLCVGRCFWCWSI